MVSTEIYVVCITCGYGPTPALLRVAPVWLFVKPSARGPVTCVPLSVLAAARLVLLSAQLQT
jgi:hypothetical protein